MGYIIHKAVEFGKISAALRKRNKWAIVDDLSTVYAAQYKYDGCNVVMDTRVTDKVLSRTGESYTSMAYQASLAADRYQGLVLLGEAWREGSPFNLVSGEFRRGQPSQLQLRVFDALTYREWDQGYSDAAWQDRFLRFQELYIQGESVADLYIKPASTFNPGTYGPAQTFCNQLVGDANNSYYDGLILRDPQGTWTKGASGTTGEIVKVKRVMSFDLRVIGVQPGQGKLEGMAGALLVNYYGKTLSVSGGTFAERKMWLDDPGSIIGRIIEVEAMDYSSDGLLREPRNKGIRFDKLKADDE